MWGGEGSGIGVATIYDWEFLFSRLPMLIDFFLDSTLVTLLMLAVHTLHCSVWIFGLEFGLDSIANPKTTWLCHGVWRGNFKIFHLNGDCTFFGALETGTPVFRRDCVYEGGVLEQNS